MGFVLSILYLLAYFLSPSVIFGPLANFRIELILAVLIFVASVPKFLESWVFKTPQAGALLGLAFTVFVSIFLSEHWFGGAVTGFMMFIPSIYAYFIVCLHFDTKKKLQTLVLMLLFVCVFDIAHGAIDLYRGASSTAPSVSPTSGRPDMPLWDEEHPYVLAMKGAQGEWIYRIRGLDVIHDPNDFGQLIVSVIPLLFFFWKPQKTLSNVIRVVVPLLLLVTGIFLTHSRGALVALAAVLLFAARRKLGSVSAMVVTGGMFVAGLALNFTGGREISAESGSDRTDLWSAGLTLLKEHPLFGVGFGQFKQYAANTAHNSVVVCAAEVGTVGLFFWSLFLLPTMRNAFVIGSPKAVEEPIAPAPEAHRRVHYSQIAMKTETLDKAEINLLGWSIALSLVGYLAAGWFLSRAFVMSLFMLGGIAEVVFEIARRQGMVAPRMPIARSLKYSAFMMVAAVFMIYMMLRLTNLTR